MGFKILNRKFVIRKYYKIYKTINIIPKIIQLKLIFTDLF